MAVIQPVRSGSWALNESLLRGKPVYVFCAFHDLSTLGPWRRVGNPRLSKTPFGLGAGCDEELNTTGSVQGWNASLPSALPAVHSLLIGYIPRTTTTTQNAGIAGGTPASTGVGNTPTLGQSSTYAMHNNADVQFTSRADVRLIASSVLTAGRPVAIGQLQLGGSIQGFIDGESAGSFTTSNNRTFDTFCVGHGGTSALSTYRASPPGDVYFALAVGGQLPASEFRRLSRVLLREPEAFLQPRRIWVPSAGGGTTISVPAASLTLTGIAPAVTATANIAIAVPAAALTLTSFAPTVLQSQMVQVPAAALTLTPYAPTVAATANQFINPPAAALTLTGYAPSVVSGGSASISVPAAGLTLTGYVPTVTAGASALIAVPAGALALTGFAPAVVLGTTVAVPAGSLTLTSFAPSVVTTTGSYVDVPAAALALTGYAPSVSNGISSIPTMPPYITVYMWKRTA